ncbi:MAG TPA: response regulator [Pyrinomonadaceae bacterium]|jgi:CheY-like chemotaxis protein|nr:response regulator [Pyrinomonadaceae bacterium]
MTDTSRHNSHPTVVVAEDHEDSRFLFKTFLESKGCRVVEAADGLEAVAAVERERPDLVLMDVSLPGLDGLSATRRLRAQESLRALPVVLISGHAEERDRDRAVAAGCSEYLTKPLELRQLDGVLERHVRMRAV